MILCLPVALALGLQADSCRRQGSPDPAASRAPQAQSTPESRSQSVSRAGGVAGAKAKRGVEVRALMAGEWGGRRVSLTVTETGASIEYDCAHGTIDERVILDAEGRFDVRGTHEDESGGTLPATSVLEESGSPGGAKGAGAHRRAARYTGRVEGRTLSLTVMLDESAQAFGTFNLTHGAPARLYKCLR